MGEEIEQLKKTLDSKMREIASLHDELRNEREKVWETLEQLWDEKQRCESLTDQMSRDGKSNVSQIDSLKSQVAELEDTLRIRDNEHADKVDKLNTQIKSLQNDLDTMKSQYSQLYSNSGSETDQLKSWIIDLET